MYQPPLLWQQTGLAELSVDGVSPLNSIPTNPEELRADTVPMSTGAPPGAAVKPEY